MKPTTEDLGASPTRPRDKAVKAFDIVGKSKTFYDQAGQAVDNLMDFLDTIYLDQQRLCVTYIDEAQELEERIWIMMRLISHQKPKLRMWYVFMGTKSSISYFNPSPKNCMSSIFARVPVSH
jgi:hypothetical protein